MPNDSTSKSKLRTLSIGIVGGSIFAVTSFTVELALGAAPTAFLIAGIVALLTSYSYLKLSLRFPEEGGTVDFPNRALGTGVGTNAANTLLLLSHAVLVSIYTFAFGSYGAGFLTEEERIIWRYAPVNGVILALIVLIISGAQLVVRSENVFNVTKMLLLGVFVITGCLTPIEWSRLGPENFASPLTLVS